MFEENKKFEEWTPEAQRELYIDFMENNDVKDSAEVKQSEARLLAYIGRINATDKTDIEDMISYIGFERERQGLVSGFQYALQMRTATQKDGVAL